MSTLSTLLASANRNRNDKNLQKIIKLGDNTVNMQRVMTFLPNLTRLLSLCQGCSWSKSSMYGQLCYTKTPIISNSMWVQTRHSQNMMRRNFFLDF